MYWGKEPVPQPPFKMENQKPFLLPRLPYKYDSNNIAATAYALLACMDHQDNNEPIVMWLNAQRLKDGGWASTQVHSRIYAVLHFYSASYTLLIS